MHRAVNIHVIALLSPLGALSTNFTQFTTVKLKLK